MQVSTKHTHSKMKKNKQQYDRFAFYLDQSEQTNTAKNDLLDLTHNFQNYGLSSFNSTKGSSNCMKTYCNSVQSWHGQFLPQSIPNKPEKIQISTNQSYSQQLSEKNKRINTTVQNKREYLKSGHHLQNLARFSLEIKKNVKRRSRSSTDWGQHNNKIISLIPKLDQSLSSFRQHRGGSLTLRKKKTIKPVQSQLVISRQDLKQTQSNINIKPKQKNLFMTTNGILQTSLNNLNKKCSTQKGMLGSTLRKTDQKGRWIKYAKNPSNICRVYQLQTNNSPLKRQLNKIMDLLKQEDNFNKIQRSQ